MSTTADRSGSSDDDAAAVSSLRAIAHPVRLRILSLLTGSAMSAAEVARELDLTHANASYHLRVLADADEIEEAGEERIRGGVAKRYRYPAAPTTQPATPPTTPPGRRPTTDDQVFYLRAVGQEMERRVQQRAPAKHPQVSSDLEGWVTPETWKRACELMAEASQLLHQHNQAPRTPGTIHVSATEIAFQMTDERPEQPEQPEHSGEATR